MSRTKKDRKGYKDLPRWGSRLTRKEKRIMHKKMRRSNEMQYRVLKLTGWSDFPFSLEKSPRCGLWWW
jgi:hypothetical protein